ncbi:MAG TPA: hypothetical protein VLS93_12890 [Anaeromyxobacteraceae bacterium]|nr:hypothetical protein [Anaeromyxobacteraceae bacterium]
MNAITVTGAALLVILLGANPKKDWDPRDAGPNRLDVSGYPPEQQKNYDVYSVKCAKCHPLARSINARFTAIEWKRYMKRMIRRPNSGINEEQAAAIYDFLKFRSTNEEM